MRAALLPSLLALLAATPASAAQTLSEQPPIDYPAAVPDDAVERMRTGIERGEVRLTREERSGFLRALLAHLEIRESSQVLVFSKTSFQRDRIAPDRPRALYFNDEVYVGYVRGGDVLELSATDSRNGPMFYTVDQEAPARPRVVRHTDTCLQCHEGSLTGGVPGHIVRSVFPDPLGNPILSAGTFRTTDASPLAERWGGWYVTGTHGAQRHLGNQVFADAAAADAADRERGANVTSLAGRFDAADYPSAHSDLVALMVLEHQARLHNLLTQCSYQVRIALRDDAVVAQALGRQGERMESTGRRIAGACMPVLRALLFADEAALVAPVAGTSAFAQEFAQRGPRDAQGRSLRELDLATRLFRHRCSYLVYGRAWDGLPAEALDWLYRRLHETLTRADAADAFPRLPVAERRAIREILLATKPGLPGYWRD